jgi:hypothetical protein
MGCEGIVCMVGELRQREKAFCISFLSARSNQEKTLTEKIIRKALC